MARIKLKVFLTLVGVGLACSMGGSSVAQDQQGVAGADGQLILGQAAAAAPEETPPSDDDDSPSEKEGDQEEGQEPKDTVEGEYREV